MERSKLLKLVTDEIGLHLANTLSTITGMFPEFTNTVTLEDIKMASSYITLYAISQIKNWQIYDKNVYFVAFPKGIREVQSVIVRIVDGKIDGIFDFDRIMFVDSIIVYANDDMPATKEPIELKNNEQFTISTRKWCLLTNLAIYNPEIGCHKNAFYHNGYIESCASHYPFFYNALFRTRVMRMAFDTKVSPNQFGDFSVVIENGQIIFGQREDGEGISIVPFAFCTTTGKGIDLKNVDDHDVERLTNEYKGKWTSLESFSIEPYFNQLYQK
jgi:hypothetical protein